MARFCMVLSTMSLLRLRRRALARLLLHSVVSARLRAAHAPAAADAVALCGGFLRLHLRHDDRSLRTAPNRGRLRVGVCVPGPPDAGAALCSEWRELSRRGGSRTSRPPRRRPRPHRRTKHTTAQPGHATARVARARSNVARSSRGATEAAGSRGKSASARRRATWHACCSVRCANLLGELCRVRKERRTT